MADLDISQSHINTGTAAVAGKAVTGTGTAWLGIVRKGDLYGTHRGNGVRIASVNSNTSLTLAYDVPALAQANGPYEIQRTPYDVGYLQAIEDLIRKYGIGILPALAELDGTGGDKLVGLTGSGSAAAIGAKLLLAMNGLDGTGGDKGLMLGGKDAPTTFALTGVARQLLDDATFGAMRETLGVNSPLFVNTGSVRNINRAWDYYVGIGVTDLPPGFSEGFLRVSYNPDLANWKTLEFVGVDSTVRWQQSQRNGVWGAWQSTRDAALLTGLLDAARVPETLSPVQAFRRGNIIGTVSQLGGVPTGALVERALTATGYYERYAGGLQVCVTQFQIYLDSVLYQIKDLPATFVSTSAYSTAISFATSALVGSSSVWNDSVDGIVAYNMGPGQAGLLWRRAPVGVSGLVYMTSTGRWF